MARNMLKEKSLPKSFWADAFSCAFYLLNRCPTRSLENMTPHEAWSTHKPSVSHLRVFRCITYAKILGAKRTKLEDKGEKFILVGYDDRTMGYKLYNPITKRVFYSKDNIFKENDFWGWDQAESSRNVELTVEEEEPAQPREEEP